MDLSTIDKLPYRNNVSCVTVKADKFLLIQNNDWLKNWWKFPQGGVEEEETLEEAASRELQEELGSDKFRIIGRSTKINQYDWNDESLKLAGYRWRGQIQKFLLVEFFGTYKDIKINLKEIRQYKWVTIGELWSNIDHEDKNFTNYKSTIERVLREFKFLKEQISN